MLRGCNACRGELRRRAELHGLLVAFLRVGRSELSAVLDDIALMAHAALLHSALVQSSPSWACFPSELVTTCSVPSCLQALSPSISSYPL